MSEKNINPFLIIPWEENFINTLVTYVYSNYKHKLQDVLLIFPHARPQRYLKKAISENKNIIKPCLIPKSYSITDFLNQLLPIIEDKPKKNIELLDKIYILYKIINKNIKKSSSSGLFSDEQVLNYDQNALSPANDIQSFFSWGIHLAKLMDDFFIANIAPQNLLYTENIVGSFAAKLLEELSTIWNEYIVYLEDNELTTPAYDVFILANAILEIQGKKSNFSDNYKQKFYNSNYFSNIFQNQPDFKTEIEYTRLKDIKISFENIFPSLKNKEIVLAGFHTLSNSEKIIFHYFWQNGMKIILHTDPLLDKNYYGQVNSKMTRHNENLNNKFTDRQDNWQNEEQKVKSIHWSCLTHKIWATNWHSSLTLINNSLLYQQYVENIYTSPTLFENKNITIYEGYDLHSQLNTVQELFVQEYSKKYETPLSTSKVYVKQNKEDNYTEEVKGNITEKNIAIVLPNTSLLLPVLHFLPKQDINITMGFSLEQSPFIHLIEIILKLQEGAKKYVDISENTEQNKQNTYHWKAILSLLRHPYLRISDEKKEKQTLQQYFNILETIIYQGLPFVNPLNLQEDVENILAKTIKFESRAELFTTVNTIFDLCLTKWEKINNLAELADNLDKLSLFLLKFGSKVWKNFPIDSECLYRLLNNIIPELKNSFLSKETLNQKTLFTILRQILNNQRVPFEADPLIGLQILGLLETRLLNFNHTFIIDATEDSIIPKGNCDPLLPDYLRQEIGLPDQKEKEQHLAYIFYRLIQASDKIDIFYQKSNNTSELLDNKKVRNRFLEEIIWQKEKQNKKLLEFGESPLFSINLPIRLKNKKDFFIFKTDTIKQSIFNLLQNPISHSSLSTYLNCPLRFFYERIAKINPVKEISEGDDPLIVGDFLHNLLNKFFSLYLREEITTDFYNQEKETVFNELFANELKNSKLLKTLPYHSLLMFQESVPYNLKQVFKDMPTTKILYLEKELEADISILSFLPESENLLNNKKLFNNHIKLTGRIDRIDERKKINYTYDTTSEHDNKITPYDIIILDYKAKEKPNNNIEFWHKDDPIWDKLKNWNIPAIQKNDEKIVCFSLQDEVLNELNKKNQSLQLIIYYYLCQKNHSLLFKKNQEIKNISYLYLIATQNKTTKPENTSVNELSLLNNNFLNNNIYDLTEQIPIVLAFLLLHLQEYPYFYPSRSQKCTWCPYANLCEI